MDSKKATTATKGRKILVDEDGRNVMKKSNGEAKERDEEKR